MGATLTVGPRESIQTAIDGAGEGDVIVVEAGVYMEKLVLDEGIVLRGIGRPKIDAGGSGSGITLQSEGAVVLGFEVSGSGPGEREAGIRVLAENCTVTDNLVVGNGIGILLQDVKGVIIRRNEVLRNEVGIFLETSAETRSPPTESPRTVRGSTWREITSSRALRRLIPEAYR